MRTSIWIAIGLFVAVAAWLASGLVIDGGGESEQEAETARPEPTLVEVRSSRAQQVPQYIYAQGVAQPYRTTDVISPTGGTLEEVDVQQGETVEVGTELAQVRLEARESQLQSARAGVESLQADLEAARRLQDRGFATASRVRELETQLENARATLESVRNDIQDTTIEAPIPGIISDVFVNSGQTATAGTAIARIVDNAPLRVTLNISQRDVGRVDVGREAVVSFATDHLAKGRLCFVAPAADPQTRTFRVEIRVPNEERAIPSVISTEVRFPTGEATAHFISPAILALDDAGNLGVESVDDDNTVRFHPVEIVRTDEDGIWVGGLPEEVRLITVGQGFVREGERVRIRQAQGQDQEAASGLRGSGAPTPTATVETRQFDGAAELPEPPPARELCRGSAANAMLTSSVPAGGREGETGLESQPGGTRGFDGPQGSSAPTVTPDSSGTMTEQPATPTLEPVSPTMPSPPIEQSPPQVPGATGRQQEPDGAAAGNGAIGGDAPQPSGADAGASGGSASQPGGGGTEGGGQ